MFLDLVTKQQEEIANRRFNEESQELREYRVKMKCRDVIVKMMCKGNPCRNWSQTSDLLIISLDALVLPLLVEWLYSS